MHHPEIKIRTATFVDCERIAAILDEYARDEVLLWRTRDDILARIDTFLVAYSGDSAWTPGLVEAARGADLFICESYTYDTQLPNHLDYKTLLEHRDELGCKRIILTHMGPGMLDRLDQVKMDTAEDGMTISV